MIKDGLLVIPELKNTEKYLEAGSRTQIIEQASKFRNETDGLTIRNILVWMHKRTKRSNNLKDDRKFKRNSIEILKSTDRTGCCDSCTLFTSLARSAGIPTIQLITLNKRCYENMNNNPKVTSGHFFAAVYLKDTDGNYNWNLIDPDRYVENINEVKIVKLNFLNRNIGDFYIYAYVKDYYDDLHIDSIEKMSRIQLFAYNQCNKVDFDIDVER